MMFDLKYIYIFVFGTLAAWALFAYFTTTEIIINQKEYAHIINIAGKQRMLSQKTALISKRFNEEHKPDLKKHLKELLLQMEKAHQDIITKHLLSKRIVSIYHDQPNALDLKTRHYLKLISDFLEEPDKELLQQIEVDSYALLPVLNEAVSAFEQDSNEKTELLMQRELFILTGTLLTLLLEALFIVIPAIRRATQRETELNAIIKDRTAKLQELSETDQLTKLYNRRHIDKILSSELERAKRYKHPFSLILLDIDHFKTINDTHGHQIGDYILRELSSILSKNVRNTDMVGRWGGEEFLILTTEDDFSKIMQFVEKLRTVIETYHFHTIDRLTCSFGVTHYVKGDSETSIMSRVDNALYCAKDSGRNCVKSTLPV